MTQKRTMMGLVDVELTDEQAAAFDKDETESKAARETWMADAPKRARRTKWKKRITQVALYVYFVVVIVQTVRYFQRINAPPITPASSTVLRAAFVAATLDCHGR